MKIILGFWTLLFFLCSQAFADTTIVKNQDGTFTKQEIVSAKDIGDQKTSLQSQVKDLQGQIAFYQAKIIEIQALIDAKNAEITKIDNANK